MTTRRRGKKHGGRDVEKERAMSSLKLFTMEEAPYDDERRFTIACNQDTAHPGVLAHIPE